jgi:hypothetical protein
MPEKIVSAQTQEKTLGASISAKNARFIDVNIQWKKNCSSIAFAPQVLVSVT